MAVFLEAPYVNAEQISELLVAYGKELYYSGKSYGRYSETINAVASRRSVLKLQLYSWCLGPGTSHLHGLRMSRTHIIHLYLC